MVLMIFLSSQELSFKYWDNLVITPAQLSSRQLWYEFYLWSHKVDIARGKDDILYYVTVHFLPIKSVLSDNMFYVAIFHCSLGRSHNTGLTVSNF